MWIDGKLALHIAPGLSGSFAITGMGADYKVGTGFPGVALYVDYMRDISGTGSISGLGGLVGPYVSVALTPGVTLDASVLAGRSWNSAAETLFGEAFTGSFTTDRWVINSKLAGQWRVSDALLVRPDLRLLPLDRNGECLRRHQRQRGLSIPVAGFSTSTLRLGAGGSVEQSFEIADDLTLTPELGVHLGIQRETGASPSSGYFGPALGCRPNARRWRLDAQGTVGLNADTSSARFPLGERSRQSHR